MIRRLFSAEGDMTIGQFVDESPATIQAVATILKTFQGEWFLDTRYGIAYFQEIFRKPADINRAQLLIKEAILGVEGVSGLNSFDATFDSNTRKMTITFEATTSFGDTFTDEQVQGINIKLG